MNIYAGFLLVMSFLSYFETILIILALVSFICLAFKAMQALNVYIKRNR